MLACVGVDTVAVDGRVFRLVDVTRLARLKDSMREMYDRSDGSWVCDPSSSGEVDGNDVVEGVVVDFR